MSEMVVTPKWGIFDLNADGSVLAWERQPDDTLKYFRFPDADSYHKWLKERMRASLPITPDGR